MRAPISPNAAGFINLPVFRRLHVTTNLRIIIWNCFWSSPCSSLFFSSSLSCGLRSFSRAHDRQEEIAARDRTPRCNPAALTSQRLEPFLVAHLPDNIYSTVHSTGRNRQRIDAIPAQEILSVPLFSEVADNLLALANTHGGCHNKLVWNWLMSELEMALEVG